MSEPPEAAAWRATSAGGSRRSADVCSTTSSRRPIPTGSRGSPTSPSRSRAGSAGRSAHADPRAPAFQRQNDLFTQWGGPNADNVYRHARRRSGRCGTASPGACTRATTSSSPSAPGSCTWSSGARSSEVTALGARHRPGRRVRAAARRRRRARAGSRCPTGRGHGVDPRVLLRLGGRRAGDFTIECLDADGPPARRTRRGRWPRSSTKPPRSWSTRSGSGTATSSTPAPSGTDNSFAPPLTGGEGSRRRPLRVLLLRPRARRGAARRQRRPRRALLEPAALHARMVRARGRGEPIDDAQPRQARSTADGRLRVVVADRDPGRRELARHRWPTQRAPHVPVVLAAAPSPTRRPRRALRRGRRPPPPIDTFEHTRSAGATRSVRAAATWPGGPHVTWHPPPRAEWVRAVNAGRVSRSPRGEPAVRPRPCWARPGPAGPRRTRRRGFGDDDFLEPFGVVLPALEDEADLTVFGRWFARGFVTRLLEVRLQLADLRRRRPRRADERIAAPIVVTGAPRTGTTLLYGLLACDPRHRVPEGWELLRPVPPPDPDTFATDPRIPLADLELQLPQVVASGLGSHPRVRRAHAQGVPVGDVVRVPLRGVREPVPRADLRRLAAALRHAPRLRDAPARAAGAAAPLHRRAVGAEVAGAPALAARRCSTSTRTPASSSPTATRSRCSRR